MIFTFNYSCSHHFLNLKKSSLSITNTLISFGKNHFHFLNSKLPLNLTFKYSCLHRFWKFHFFFLNLKRYPWSSLSNTLMFWQKSLSLSGFKINLNIHFLIWLLAENFTFIFWTWKSALDYHFICRCFFCKKHFHFLDSKLPLILAFKYSCSRQFWKCHSYFLN